MPTNFTGNGDVGLNTIINRLTDADAVLAVALKT
jgi:hypothetical protein